MSVLWPRRLVKALCIASAAALWSTPATAQFFELPVDIAPPGARAAGMGASFIALANDATAGSANPAGLTSLPEPEISTHFRFSRVTSQSQILGEVIRDTSTAIVPSFFSYVQPLAGNRLALSGYFSREVSAEHTREFTWQRRAPGNQVGDYRFFDSTRINIDHIGAAIAVSPTSRLSVGASIRASRGSLEGIDRAEDFYNTDLGLTPRQYFFRGTTTGSQTKPTFTLGAKYSIGEHLGVGGVFRQGQTFAATRQSEVTATGGVSPPISIVEFDEEIRLPMAYGVGGYYQTGKTLLLVDIVRPQYSRGDFNQTYPARFLTEVHVGFERTFQPKAGRLLTLRAGAYTDPGHHPREGEQLSQVLNPGEDRINTDRVFVTTGAGVVVSGNTQLDVALKVAEDRVDVLLSTVVKF